jgi:hypothetical protein
MATDDDTKTFWLADPASNATAILVVFAEPTDLGGLVFHPGSATDATFQLHRRPRTIRLTFQSSNPGPAPAPIEFDLKDQSEPDTKSLDVRKITIMEIRIVTSFDAGQGGDGLIAIREIEFKARR